jgi:hypothetical protein
VAPKEPGAQLVHAAEPAAAYVPARHVVGAVAPSGQATPVAHCAQSASTAPDLVLNEPCGHETHVTVAPLLYVLAVQGAQAADPAAAPVPAAQLPQLAAPVPLAVPGAQAAHEVAPVNAA